MVGSNYEVIVHTGKALAELTRLPKAPQYLFFPYSNPRSLCSPRMEHPLLTMLLPPAANRSSKFFLNLMEELDSHLSFERNEARTKEKQTPDLPRRGAIFKSEKETLLLSERILLSLYYSLSEGNSFMLSVLL